MANNEILTNNSQSVDRSANWRGVEVVNVMWYDEKLKGWIYAGYSFNMSKDDKTYCRMVKAGVDPANDSQVLSYYNSRVK